MASLPGTPAHLSAVTASASYQSEPGTNSPHDRHFICSEIENDFGEDLTSNKVLLPHDKFLEAILNVPPLWETSAHEFKKLVDNVEHNSQFCRTLQIYVNLCNDSSKTTQSLYGDFVSVCNEAADIVQETMKIPKEDPSRLKGPLRNYGMVQLLSGQNFEICMLDHGIWARVVMCHNGNDPSHFFPNSPEFIAAQNRVQECNTKSTEIRNGCKRVCASSATYPNKRPRLEKMEETRTAVSPVRPELPPSSLAREEAKGHSKALAQVARRALATLSYMGFRTHSISLIVARHYIQVLYYDRSALVISPPFDMKNPRRRRQFISLLIAIQMLDLPQSGVMKAFLPDPFPRIFENHATADPSLLLAGQKVFIDFQERTIIVTLGRIIYNQPGIIGRNTWVVEGSCSEWAKKKIVVKISWPTVERLSEVRILDTITTAVTAAGEKGGWVLNHIPTILHAQDFSLSENSPGMRLHKLLNDEATLYASDTGSFMYELRVCRVIIQERLNPLADLTNQKDYAQVFFDVLQVHRWIYEFARILHRDISEGNIMWHKRGEKIYGVLNDFDLSFQRDLPEQTSALRMGTRPFMAYELQKVADTPVLPLYRHDLESLFYVLLIVVCGHSLAKVNGRTHLIVATHKNPGNLHRWFTMDDEDLYGAKLRILFPTFYSTPVKPSESFKGFDSIVRRLRTILSRGFRAVVTARESRRRVVEEDDSKFTWNLDADMDADAENTCSGKEGVEEIEEPAVDMDTLEGHVTYAAFYRALRVGLVERFCPT